MELCLSNTTLQSVVGNGNLGVHYHIAREGDNQNSVIHCHIAQGNVRWNSASTLRHFMGQWVVEFVGNWTVCHHTVEGTTLWKSFIGLPP